ncbi:DUF4239 domain-containing protein [Thermomonospora umbrina]|uniref:Uncharacterized protein DUF4239 n=1 Tax=Thermomonospora umbrina TaxID=111806 RepID=A0A3D9ST95_9ACTN|nr:DUF4239 domain-containing protein [Thermomonospora umbrina]REE94921.1 uncharacterized protein DUF4239 [Thermomonospora umbrina]
MVVYVLAAVAAIGVVLIASRLVRGKTDEEPDGPTSGHTGSMLAALFLLAFAIAIVVPWTTIDAARQNTYAESQAVAEAYWSATQLPAPTSGRVQAGLRDYVELVRGHEWELMRDGRLSPDGWSRLEEVRREVTALRTEDDDVREARTAVLDRVREISASRRQRAMDAVTTPPPGLLVMTLVAGLSVVLFPFLTGARPRGRTLVPLAIMSGLLAIGVYLVFDISHVFAGALAVQPDAFDNVLPELRRISAGVG